MPPTLGGRSFDPRLPGAAGGTVLSDESDRKLKHVLNLFMTRIPVVCPLGI